MDVRKLPLGIDDFEKLRNNDFYYVDKTGMIAELLRNWGEVNLFTRPRRFGKSLNMSMLKAFFEPNTDKRLFDGLSIAGETELCNKYMGQYPVIFLTLKTAEGIDFADAKEQMWSAVSLEADRHDYMTGSNRLDDIDQDTFRKLRSGKGNLSTALLQLSRLLYKYHEQKVIILIDEYDVPLQKAEQYGYYPQMVQLISQFFSSGMKTNPYIQFAVVTGCLRIAKESIFTGFNNPKLHTIADERYDEWFGFTDEEVHCMLEYYDRSEYFDLTREWYDGYLFGNTHVYSPWDVISWCDKIVNTSQREPENFWANSSGNEMIRRFIGQSNQMTRDLLGELIEGKSVRKKLNFELTYNEIDSSVENLWSVMFMTGYLTQRGRNEEGEFELVLPNREVKNLFKDIVEKWFSDKVMKDQVFRTDFFAALDSENGDWLEKSINYILNDSISFLDGGRIDERENFYHGLLLGMLNSRLDWNTKSNREAGDGRLDIVAYDRNGKRAMIFELKYAERMTALSETAQKALSQIKTKRYNDYLDFCEPEKITHCGIAFHKKRCRVVMEACN